jgi:hypothetical protein
MLVVGDSAAVVGRQFEASVGGASSKKWVLFLIF